ncbi:MAG: hypothetical protein K6A35_02450 [bacterium]|nr:hypothetical protein [bacterium]
MATIGDTCLATALVAWLGCGSASSQFKFIENGCLTVRSFNYSRPLGEQTCNISTPLFRLVNVVHEYKGKQDVVADVDPAVLSDLPVNTILKNVESFCSNNVGLAELSEEGRQELEKELKQPDFFERVRPVPRNSNFDPEELKKLQIQLYAKNFLRLQNPQDFELSVDSIVDLYRSLLPYETEIRDCWPKYTDRSITFGAIEPDNGVRYLQVQSRGFPLLMLSGGKLFSGDIVMQAMSSCDVRLALHEACDSFNEVSKYFDPLVVIPRFILDFLCISPFDDSFGNLLVAQLLLMLLLAKAGYPVYRYISFELVSSHLSSGRITGNDLFNSAFRESIGNWHMGSNDYTPFTEYCLRHLSLAFRYFFYRLLPLGGRDRKAKCIKALFYDESVTLTKSDIHDLCYEISVPTIESVLGKLSGELGFLEKVGRGRNTAYRRCEGVADVDCDDLGSDEQPSIGSIEQGE